MRRLAFLFVIVLAGSLAACRAKVATPVPPPPAPERAKLAVVIYFDQMRGDYLEKWQPLFGDGGFKRMQDDGAWFVDCHYPYGTTTTGPGHASVLAGCSGNKHGIINNNWYDRESTKTIYCAASPRYDFVPAPTDVAPPDPTKPPPAKKEAGNPDRFLGETLADVLKETNGQSKAFGLSLKDRSAIFPMGRKPDGAYWFAGRFLTSTYYRDSVPPWVDQFNKSKLADSYYGKDWTYFRPDLDYSQHTGRDDGPGEGKGKGQGVKFPHPTTGGTDKLGPEYYTALATSPYGNDLLLAFAKECITAEQLGQDDAPDLLTVSFSSNDLIGHAWGPDSHEVLDVTLRSDAMMADFLKFLDEKVGKGKYVVLVTADHGICPNPEVSAAQGQDAKRISPTKLLIGAERVLRDAFGKPTDDATDPVDADDKKDDKKADEKKDRNLWIEAVSAPYVYLNLRRLKAANLSEEVVAEKLAEWMRTQPGVFRAFTRKQLMDAAPTDDATLAQMRRSYHPDRGGNVAIVLKPYYLLDSYTTGTTHGSPHSYDTHAPFLVYGPGVDGGKRTEKVTPLHGAAAIAQFLGVRPPKNAEYSVPTALLKP